MSTFHDPKNFIAWFPSPHTINEQTLQGGYPVTRLGEQYDKGITRIYLTGPDGAELGVALAEVDPDALRLVYPEWPEAQKRFASMSAEECLSLMDSLYGRWDGNGDDVNEETAIETLRCVAERQSLQDFTYRNTSQERSDRAYYKALGALY